MHWGNSVRLAAAIAVIASAAKQSSLSLQLWIASRSLSSGAHSRYPLARNDGFNLLSLMLQLPLLHPFIDP
jgi:hypothetical protein